MMTVEQWNARNLTTLSQHNAKLVEALAMSRATLKATYEAHKKARDMVPDEEEGLAAQVFCRVINHVDAPIIEALAYADQALNEGVQP